MKRFIFLYMSGCFTCMYVCALVQRYQKRVLGPLGLELGMAVSHMGAGNGTSVPYKNKFS